MSLGLQLAEQGRLPERVVRLGIRRLLRKRLADEARRRREGEDVRWLEAAQKASAVAPVPELANSQHYEVPAAFYELALGKQLKYSAAYWPEGVTRLDDAEEAMLALTAERARLGPRQRVLELGCGWGSLTLWMARRFPTSTFVAVSNSRSQREHITARAEREGLTNVRVITADMNVFTIEERFDRIVSVEMFEHMRNWSALLSRARGWLEDNGLMFLHVFAHRRYVYPFDDSGEDDWMARHFFSGGLMPSVDMLERIESPFKIEARWVLAGTHYQRTAEAWLANLRARREAALAVLGGGAGVEEGRLQYRRWELFFTACAELFGFADGSEWVVVHQLLGPEARGGA